jgi:uncharacterized membrane protein
MAHTVVGLFRSYDQAQQAVAGLVNMGVRAEDISVVASDAEGKYTRTTGDEHTPGEAAGTGAASGGVLGGVLGALVGIGALALPGIGPVLAVGPLAAALGSAGAGALIGAATGAISGGLIGALVEAGVPDEHAHVYAEGVRRGGTLVTVHAVDTMSDNVAQHLRTHGAVDVDDRGTAWRQSGWDRFDPNAEPYRSTSNNDWEESSKIGTATGTAAGAATGAAIGAAGGPVGAVVGGVVGAATGAATGAAGDVAGEKAEDTADGTRTDYDATARRRRGIYDR